MSSRRIQLVGSVPLESSESVFRELAQSIGGRASRYPDGETGRRSQWIRWQRQTFEDHPDFVLDATSASIGKYSDAVSRPLYRLSEGVRASDTVIKDLNYATEALASHAVFSRLRREGVIPAGVRFQVSLPTATALATGFFRKEHRTEVEPLIEDALVRELRALTEGIPAGELAVQWDVCHEVLGADGGVDLHYSDIVRASCERVARLLDQVDQDVQAGIHLCYGDPGHRHIIEPDSLATCVEFANGILRSCDRNVTYVHMPVPRDRDDDEYFAPLTDLNLPVGTELYLGLIHYSDGVEGSRRRLVTSERYASGFGIATECGFGRRDPETIPALLRIHAEIADLSV